ncbi:hypothetical protein BH20ACT2_BH20ACT2_04950 [soil metagenome]
MDLRKHLEGIARMLRPTAPGEFLRSERRMKAAVRLTSLSVVLVLLVSVAAYRGLADDGDQDVASAGLERSTPSDLPSPGVDALTTTSPPDPAAPPPQSPSGSTTTMAPGGRPTDPSGQPPTTLPSPSSTSTPSPSSTATTVPGGPSTSTTEPPVAEFDERVVTPPTHTQGDAAGPLLIGSFDGDRDLDGGCTWLVQPNGVERSVRWPAGTTIRFFRTLADPDTFQVIDADGEVVLRRGERVEFGLADPVETPLDRCQVGTEPALSLREGSFRSPPPPPS